MSVIRSVQTSDAAAICAIYNKHVAETFVTFEEEQITEAAMVERIERISAAYPYVVYECEGQVMAYAYADAWRSRSAYRFTAETTIYVDETLWGKGVGRTLYQRLLDDLKAAGFHVAIGVITLPNDASEALHKSFGFERAGVFKEVGKKFDQWRDVVFWSLRLGGAAP